MGPEPVRQPLVPWVEPPIFPPPPSPSPMSRRSLPMLALLAALTSAPLVAQVTDSSTITLDQIFSSNYFSTDYVPPTRWADDGKSYYAFDRREAGGVDLAGSTCVTDAPLWLAASDATAAMSAAVDRRRADVVAVERPHITGITA